MIPALDFGFVILTADNALGIENGILGVGMEHILCAITNTDIDGTLKVVSKKERKGVLVSDDALASMCWGLGWPHRHRFKLGLGVIWETLGLLPSQLPFGEGSRRQTRMGSGKAGSGGYCCLRHPERGWARVSSPSQKAGARGGHCRQHCHCHWVKLGERKKIKDRKPKDKKGVLASAGTDMVWLGVVVVRKAGAGESIVIVLLQACH